LNREYRWPTVLTIIWRDKSTSAKLLGIPTSAGDGAIFQQPSAWSRVDQTDKDTRSQHDVGDVLLGIQGLLTKELDRVPTIALSYSHRVYTGSAPDLDIGSSQSAVFLVSGDLEDFHCDSNFTVSEQVSNPVRRAQFGESLSVTRDLCRVDCTKLELTGEVWHFTQPAG